MLDLALFLYAYPDEDDSISDELTCVILDSYLMDNNISFDSITDEKAFISKAKKLAEKLKKHIAKTDIAARLQNMSIDYIDLTVEQVDGPEVKSWIVWEKKK